MAIYAKFNEKAQRVLEYTQQVALVMKHKFMGTEHLLLGLLKEAEDEIPSIPADLNRNNIREVVMQLYTSETEAPKSLEMTPKFKLLLENAVRLSQNAGAAMVSSAALWLALLNDETCVAMKILSVYRCDLEQMKMDAEEGVAKSKNNNGAAPEENETSMLKKHGTDLIEKARLNGLDPVIGRQAEAERMIQILSRRTKNNPILIGEPGVGKSAVVEGLAQMVAMGNVPETIKGKRLISIDIGSIVAGTKYRGEFEERMKKLVEEVQRDSNTILFFDEIQTIVGAGKAEGSIDAAGIMKPALARGDLQCIGATTLSDYRKNIEKDAALSRRFQPIMIKEPSKEESVSILKGLRSKYEQHHQLSISDEALEAAVSLSARYINDRFLPDKAVDIMDEAASRVRIRSLTLPKEIKILGMRLEELTAKKKLALESQEYEKAATFRNMEREIRGELQDEELRFKEEQTKNCPVVVFDDVASIVAEWTGVPVKQMTAEESSRLMDLEKEIHQRIVGQDAAVSSVSRAIRRSRAGLQDPNRPIGSFIFLGPTGVGKTELCRAIAETVFGDKNALIRLDMSEYMEKHTVSRMVGSPPGYVGFDEGGQLTEAVRRKPYSVVLFDEIEKAHPDVFNMLLQILEDGRLTDNTGKVTAFHNCIIVMTSNAGAQSIAQDKSLGFSSREDLALDYKVIKSRVLEETKRLFRPEFINRLDEVIVFHALTETNVEQISRLMLDKIVLRLQDKKITLGYQQEVLAYLSKEGYDPKYGARPLRRAIQKHVEDVLSDAIISGQIVPGDQIELIMDERNLVYHKMKSANQQEMMPVS